MNVEQGIQTAKRFIKGKLLQSGLEGYVVGLSGGIDSAVSASLAVRAVGEDKLFGVLMPYKTSSKATVNDAGKLADKLGIDYKLVDISPMIDSYFESSISDNRLRAGNKMARERMSILFDIAYEKNRMVLGTGNRTEICLGYTTWFGDSACSINPIGEFYKYEIYQIAKELNISENIINKAPSADLWKGQTDEEEIGLRYEKIDKLLELIVEQEMHSISELEKKGFDATDISRVISLMNRFSFKRHTPEIAPMGRKQIPDLIEIKE